MTSGLPPRVRLVEVGPRDGLQNEPMTVAPADRARLVDALAAAGLDAVEAGAFVSPKWVPQMAGTAEVLALVTPRAGTSYPVLVPNETGLDAALSARFADGSAVGEIAVFAAASESFSRRNINCTIAESLDRFRPVAARARAAGIAVRGYVSCVLGCPYEGEISPAAVARVASALIELGCYEVSLGDTIGVGTPGRAVAMIEAVARDIPREHLAVHFHDTYGQAIANIHAALGAGVATIDSAVAGLGGCPYAKGASGNVATEDVVVLLDGLGVGHGVDRARLLDATRLASALVARPPVSKAAQAWLARAEEGSAR